MPRNGFEDLTAGKWLGRMLLGAVLTVAASELRSCAGDVRADVGVASAIADEGNGERGRQETE